MLGALVLFMVALPVLAASAPTKSSDLDIRKMLKDCAEEQERLASQE